MLPISQGQVLKERFTTYIMFCSHLLALVSGDLSQMDQVHFVCHQHHGEGLPERKTTHKWHIQPQVQLALVLKKREGASCATLVYGIFKFLQQLNLAEKWATVEHHHIWRDSNLLNSSFYFCSISSSLLLAVVSHCQRTDTSLLYNWLSQHNWQEFWKQIQCSAQLVCSFRKVKQGRDPVP